MSLRILSVKWQTLRWKRVAGCRTDVGRTLQLSDPVAEVAALHRGFHDSPDRVGDCVRVCNADFDRTRLEVIAEIYGFARSL
jgi:hypothetical protein